MRYLALLMVLSVAVGSGCGDGDRSRSVGPVEERSALKGLSVEDALLLESVLLEAGAGKSVADSARYGRAFLLVSERGYLEIVEYLLSVGADLEATDDEGNTALHLSARGGHWDVVRFLLEQEGLSVGAVNDAGLTALDLVLWGSSTEVAALMATLLAEKMADPAAEARVELDGLGYSFTVRELFRAVESGNLEVVNLFLAAGMSIDAAGSEGYTALMSEARNGRLEMVRFLVENGANVNAVTAYGWTALLYAVRQDHRQDYSEIVRFLVENGANVNAMTEDGVTALLMAAERGDLEMVQFLVENGASE